MRRMTTAGVAAIVTALGLTGCSLSDSGSDSTSESSAPAAPTSSQPGNNGIASGEPTPGKPGPGEKEVVLITHDSFTAPKELLAKFTQDTGYTVKLQPSGDAGQVSNKLVLTKNSPIGDAVFGIDNTFASRVVTEGVLEPYSPKTPAPAAYELSDPAGKAALTPVDFGNTCVNIDTTWFAKKKLAPPQTFDDLLKPAYKNLFVAPGAPTSSPGLAMLLATIGAKGQDGWQDYWKKLVANGAKFTSGWEDAYNVDFTQGKAKGDRPIVWSYDTSPAFTVAGGTSTTAALLDTCFRQVEYTGVIKGAKNPAGAKALINWMQGQDFQAALAPNMYVYPVKADAPLPAEWTKFAKKPTKTFDVPPADIAKNRQAWLTTWQDITSK